ncbi:MAG: S8 family serine peptidase [Calditrichaeota bacterium]|nr:S8 family serine peptidase [Calditrichota bacterium]
MIRKIILLLVCAVIPISGFAAEKYWIFFRDKGNSPYQLTRQIEQVKKELSARTLQRREKVRVMGDVVDESDVEISAEYLLALKNIGVNPIVQSRWLNAVSAEVNENTRRQILRLGFVRKIQPVAKFRREKPLPAEEFFLHKPQSHRLDYGPSLTQNELIRVTDVHDLGFDGSGVIIGMLDTGFDYKYHEAFLHLNVVGEYDFINQDSVTQNEAGDLSSQQSHGTLTLSAIGGFAPEKLIGPAYGATFYLAKTEDVSNEYPAEEDFWVAGLEWLERNGVDVVSSSLGYLDWYSYKDMDGTTAVTTQAAEMAAQKGVVVVNSMGNEGNNSWHYMIAPADAEDVISVGAVSSDGELASFSSRGPTADGRIKPDVDAMGVSVRGATAGTVDGYRRASGTSLSCPLVAGVAALILEAHPYLSPYQVAKALRETASNAENPNNDIGWGIVDAYEAIFYHGLFFSNMPEITHDRQQGHGVTIKIFSKYDLVPDSLFVYYLTEENSHFQKLALTKVDQENAYHAWIPPQPDGSLVKLYFSARDVSGDRKTHPYFAPRDYFSFVAFDSSARKNKPLPEDFILFQNAPNPFENITAIKYDLGQPGDVKITIYNILGQKVKTIVDDFHSAGHYVRYWDGLNSSEQRMAAGIYFCQIKFKNQTSVKRMVFLGRRK